MIAYQIFAVVGLLMIANPPSTHAADIRYVPAKAVQMSLTDSAHVVISGEIVQGDVEKLRRALTKTTAGSSRLSNPLIVLNSPGGSVPVALEMGRLLRDSLAHTVVDDGSCSSSCVFLLASGVMRDVFLNGQIGLHRPRFDYAPYGSLSKDQARKTYNALVTRCVDYMKEMGASERVFSDMLKVPSQEIRFVDRNYAEEHGLVGRDPAWEEWSRAQKVLSDGEAKVKALDRRIDCHNRSADHAKCNDRYNKELNEIKARKQ